MLLYYSAHWMFRRSLRYKTFTKPRAWAGYITSRCDTNPDGYCYAEVKIVQGLPTKVT